MVACVLASCGGSGDGIKPASASIQGDAGDYFTVVDKTYPSVSSDNNSVFIEFQRTDSVFPMAESAYVSLDIDWLDKDGNVVGNSSGWLNDVYGLKPGETKAVDFIVLIGDVKKIASFKVSGEMNFSGLMSRILTPSTDVSDVIMGITSGSLSGTVGEYPVEMEFEVNDNNVTGRYRYTQTGSGEWIPLVGTFANEMMSLVEGPQGNQTGNWLIKVDYANGRDNDMSVVGQLTTTAGATHYVKLRGAGYWGDENVSDADDSYSGFDASDSFSSSRSSSSSSSSNVNIDNLLNQYEQAVNDMIKYSKKMAQNDFSAAGQMAEASSKMTELAGKLEPIVDDMTPAQAQRFLAIGAKAAQNARP